MFIVRLVGRLWRIAGVWGRGRRWLWFLQALPALLAGSAVVVAAAAALLTPAQELEARYLEQAKAALKAKDYAGAMTCYDRLAYLGTDRPDVLYGLAASAEGLGQIGRADVIMNGLAPPDKPGYAPAHLWQARRILAVPTAAPGAREAAESHLLRALDGELDDPDTAHALLGEVYLAAGHYDDAELHLTKAVQTRPQLRIRLAQLYALRGDKDRARGEAQLAVSFFRARTKADLDDRRARLGWADATAFLEDFPGAVAILQEGLSVADEPLYRVALGSVYLIWSDTVGRDPKADPGARAGARGDGPPLRSRERGVAQPAAGRPQGRPGGGAGAEGLAGGRRRRRCGCVRGRPRGSGADGPARAARRRQGARRRSFRARPRRLGARPGRRGAYASGAGQRAGAPDAGHRQQPGLDARGIRTGGPAAGAGFQQRRRGQIPRGPVLPRHPRADSHEDGSMEGRPGRPRGRFARQDG